MRLILRCLVLPGILATELWGIAYVGEPKGLISASTASDIRTAAMTVVAFGALLLLSLVLRIALEELTVRRSAP